MPWDYGSQYQLRRWVLERPDQLTADLLRRSDTLRAWASTIEWLSPNEETGAELRDEAWGLVGLPADSPQQAGWWPADGPVWDGVARVQGPGGAIGGIFVEAKGRAGELIGGGMKATAEQSIKTIRSALAEVQAHLSVVPSEEWLRACYQPANRLAFLWYARHKCQPSAPVWLVSLYFLGERYQTAVGKQVGPASEQDWQSIIGELHRRMGLPATPHDLSPCWIETFLPALKPPPSLAGVA